MTPDDGALIEAYLRHLRGQGGAPDLDRLDPEDAERARQVFDVLDAVAGMGRRELPDLENDPVVRALELDPSERRRAPVTKHSGTAEAPPPAARTRRMRPRSARGRSSTRWGRVLGLGSVAATMAAVFLVVQLGFFGSGSRAVATGTLTARCETTFTRKDVKDTTNHVVVAAVWGNTERKRFEEVLTRFSETTGIKVSFATDEPGPDRDMAGTLRKLKQQGCAPDVALLPQPGLLENLVQNGDVHPIHDVVGEELERNYSADWRGLGMVDGQPYGVWFKAANKSIIWYNANAFRRAGIERPPTTWGELKAAAERLQATGITPFAIGGGKSDGWVLTDWFENVYLATAGGENYSRLAKGEIPWTDATVKHALNLLAEIFATPEWLADTRTGVRQMDLDAAIRAVFGNATDPAAAMVFEGDFVANTIDSTPSRLGSDARFFPFPMIGSSEGAVVPARASWGETGGDIAVLMNDTDAGKRLIRFLATPEAAEPWVKRGGFISPNLNVDLDDYPDADMRRAAEALRTVTDLRFDLSDLLPPTFAGDPDSAMWTVLQDFLATPADVDGTAQRLDAAYRSALRGS